ncbi:MULTISPECIES: hypothetical protein [Brachybacterium]|uniref:Uncharacterized protein n=1 Tax=Brachybacterium kimchii TaxID=2942909 RepID=A0ABY4N7R6_9MICO|nr:MULTISPECIES: hypothetical protein [Brachybacterium]MCG7308038.1 hypothetical protein [Brachybacterium sp. ACRRE]UQN30597.1 hypothetical protein M4486_04595 [Brachybacterium kimchii]
MCAVLHAGSHAQSRELLDSFIREHHKEISRILHRAKRTAHLDDEGDSLMFSYFGQALLHMVDQRWRAKNGGPGTSQVFNYSRNLPMLLEAETRAALREDRRKGMLNDSTGVPGAGAHDRRTSLVEKSRQLYELERETAPSDDELVAFHNERMRATRRDAARQSVLITKQDLRRSEPVALDDPNASSEPALLTQDTPDPGASEREKRIIRIVRRCQQLDREREAARARRMNREPLLLADVARAYFAHHREGIYPTRNDLVRQLGAEKSAARRELGSHLRTVLEMARAAFADYRQPN